MEKSYYSREYLHKLYAVFPKGFVNQLSEETGMGYTTIRFAFTECENYRHSAHFENRQNLYALAEKKLEDLGYSLTQIKK
tara:strand:- start:1026 stop:1265 length:240 start_codon:yes stop_codon:yes gene_type:complete